MRKCLVVVILLITLNNNSFANPKGRQEIKTPLSTDGIDLFEGLKNGECKNVRKVISKSEDLVYCNIQGRMVFCVAREMAIANTTCLQIF